MLPPRAPVIGLLILCAGCAADPRPASAPAAAAAPPPLVLEGMPTATPAPARPAAAAAVDERFARERSGWRAAFVLSLPALSEPAAHRIRRAAESWLFQGYEVLPGGVAASGAAALDKLIIENPRPDGAGAAWYVDRSVIGFRSGAWLSLTRTLAEQGDAAHPTTREDALIVDSATGTALDLDQVIPPGRQAAARGVLAAALRSARHLAAGEPISGGLASDQELPIPLPTLTATGARFVWNPLEIADAAAGSFVVELSRDAVHGLLAIDPWASSP